MAGTLVVSASGELDASNIDRLTSYVQACSTDVRSLILDLSQLSFFGAQGIRALFDIADELGERRTEVYVVPAREVTRLLQICDTHHRLQTASSIDRALHAISAPSRARRLLQLVTKSG